MYNGVGEPGDPGAFVGFVGFAVISSAQHIAPMSGQRHQHCRSRRAGGFGEIEPIARVAVILFVAVVFGTLERHRIHRHRPDARHVQGRSPPCQPSPDRDRRSDEPALPGRDSHHIISLFTLHLQVDGLGPRCSHFFFFFLGNFLVARPA